MRKIYLAGHRGMVGGAILRTLQARGHTDIITRTHAELDLTDQAAVRTFMQAERPDVVILAAAKVGGILANNNYPANFIYENLMIEATVMSARPVSSRPPRIASTSARRRIKRPICSSTPGRTPARSAGATAMRSPLFSTKKAGTARAPAQSFWPSCGLTCCAWRPSPADRRP